MPEYTTIREAAAELGLEESWVRRLCIAGRIVGAVKVGRDWMIPKPVKRVEARRKVKD